MATLVYPMGGDGGDFVAFGHAKYTRNRNGNARNGAPPPMGNAIRLYMPTTTPEVTNDNGWGPLSNPGPVGQAMQDAARVVGSEKPGTAVGNTIEGLKNGFGNLAGMAHQTGVGYLARKMNMSPNNVMQLGQGAIFNPNIELMYDGPRVRSFSMQFDFIPKTQLEADRVQQIIMEFKKWSAPGGRGSGVGSMYDVPHLWTITYVTAGRTNVMNRFKRSALTKVSVQANATSDMHATFIDGFPVSTSLGLEFMEADVILREDHEAAGGQGF